MTLLQIKQSLVVCDFLNYERLTTMKKIRICPRIQVYWEQPSQVERLRFQLHLHGIFQMNSGEGLTIFIPHDSYVEQY